MKVRRFLAALAAVLLLSVMALPAQAAGSAAAQARNGVARVIMLYELDLYDTEDGDYAGTLQGYGSGTAFGVGTVGEETDVFVTNRHVVALDAEEGVYTVDDVDYLYRASVTGYYILLDNFAYNSNTYELDPSRSVPCNVIYLGEGDDADLAILRAAEPVSGRVALPLKDDEDQLAVGDAVNALGYPGSSDSATSEGYFLATVEDVTVTNGIVSRFFDSASVTADTNGLSGHLIQSSASINSGNSGGPLVDEDGVVVGINTWTYHGGSQSVTNAYYALRIRYAKEALDSLGIAYDTDAKSGPSVVWIAALAAAVVLVAVAAVLLVRSGRKKAAPGGQIPPQPAPAPQPTPQQGPSDDSGFRIQCTAGALNGRRYRIGTRGAVVLGRDPAKCGVVFPGNTPGVSAEHCAVWYEGGAVYVKDLGSTHGTYLLHGSRLTAGQAMRLAPGEGFYLGSQGQSFVIAERR